MNIKIKFYATLTPFLPSHAKKNEAVIKVNEGTSVKEVIDQFSLPLDRCHLILINGLFTPLSSSDQKILQDGDVLAIWPPVAGG